MNTNLKERFLPKSQFQGVDPNTLIETASQKIQGLNKFNNEFQKKIRSSSMLPSDYKETIETSKSKIKQENIEIKEILDELTNIKYRNNTAIIGKAKKFQEALQKEIERFANLAKEVAQKKYEFHKTKSMISAGSVEGGSGSLIEEDETMNQLKQEQFNQVEHDQGLLVERKKDLNEIEEFVGQLNSVLKEVAVEVNKQGEDIDQINVEVNRGAKNIDLANEEILVADSESKKARNKLFWMILILVVIIIIVIAVVLSQVL